MSAMASQITGPVIVYSAVYSRRRLNKTSKLRVTVLCAGNSPVTDEFPPQKASNMENASIWWRHHEQWNIGIFYIYSYFKYIYTWYTIQPRLFHRGVLFSTKTTQIKENGML